MKKEIHQKLKYPFEYEGEKIEVVEVLRRPKVRDRINASAEAREVFGEQEGDAVLLCVLAQVCRFGEKKIKIPAEILADKMDYEDFLEVFGNLATGNFSAGKKELSERSLEK